MIKVFFQILLPLLFPLMFYYVFSILKQKVKGDEEAMHMPSWPWLKLVIAGLVLMAVGLVVLNQNSGFEPGGVYHPPSVQDGKIVPGHVTYD